METKSTKYATISYLALICFVKKCDIFVEKKNIREECDISVKRFPNLAGNPNLILLMEELN